MIKKFIDRLLGKGAKAEPVAAAPEAPAVPLGERVEVPAEVHRIDASLLDDNAVRVVRTLQEAGHAAYVVGGAVRDLLVGLRPKDFDVATDATPEQVKALFRRAFIIGRRFRLVHVVFGRGREHEVIEVSTFRAYLDPTAADPAAATEGAGKAPGADRKHVVDAEGRVLRDNVWGPQIEDAARRDFTINAMYYDPTTRTVVDYHGGLADARARRLRMIGDPATRYREDPVRIVRVVRFAAKLGFDIEPATRAPIGEMAALLANVPASRLFDETIKLLQTGHAIRSVDELRKQGLLGRRPSLFPVLDAVFGGPAAPDSPRERFVRMALADTDARVADGRSVVPSFMLACMLWHDVQARWHTLRESGEAPVPALHQAVDAVFEARIGDISGRGKLAADMREVWLMQPRFERRTPSSAAALAAQPRFRAGYDFLRLRADLGEVPGELADWWEDFHLGTDDERQALLQDVRARQPAPARKTTRAPRPAPAGRAAPHRADAPQADRDEAAEVAEDAADAADAAADAAEAAARAQDEADADDADHRAAAEIGAEGAAPKKRRRRRRRPAGAGEAAAPGVAEPPAGPA